jgi:hypothetical protein
MKTTKDNLNYANMFDRVAERISNIFDLYIKRAANMLVDFEIKEGKDAVKSMFGFMRYVSTHPSDDRFTEIAIKSMFAHDLNGAGTNGFSPRTTYYIKFINE